MSSLPSSLRKQLETAVRRARIIAEAGARKSLEALAVHEPSLYPHMDEGQRALRRKLRAQAKQLGDGESRTKPGAYEIRCLVEKTAYDQWHRLLFARFLLENHLLISPEHGVSVSLDDCEELAPSLGLKDAWSVAARFAAVELPEIFRADDPAGAVELPLEDRKQLIRLVTDLPVAVFTATDSLGWCYQFWQAERKETVNKSGNKIGAAELPSVTQLFTEDYMVDFLLDNTLGAWWAGKVLAANPQLAANAGSEEELRKAASLPDCPWQYLRFIQHEDGSWSPAAGAFDGWPKSARELTCLDPCMGSGHFVVALFQRLVALRIAEESLPEPDAVAAVIRDNLFGLEIDPRCTQIAAFNLALAAWRRAGHSRLPAMNLACSGLAPNSKREDWLSLTDDAPHLRFQMGALYNLFEKAPILGSLINPRADKAVTYGDALHDLQPLLEKAMAQETKDDSAHEMAVTAQGIAKAAEILAGQFTLVATNVPYLGSGNQDEVLKDYCERIHPEAKADIATCFIERALYACSPGGSTALVTPQNWLFLGTYKKLRRRLLEEFRWVSVARLGARAFETISGEVVNVALSVHSLDSASEQQKFAAFDVSGQRTTTDKREALQNGAPLRVSQSAQLANPDFLISFEENGSRTLLFKLATSHRGHCNGDSPRFDYCFWEVIPTPAWSFLQSAPQRTAGYEGRHHVLFWEQGRGQLVAMADELRAVLKNVHKRGAEAWGRPGIVVKQMGKLPTCIYSGEIFDGSCATVIPHDQKHLLAIWAFCSSPDFNDSVRRLNQKMNVENGFFVKVPFDLARWQKVAAEKYPDGLPKPFSSDPTQWLFNSHPKGSDNPLHVAVARLLGYQWPRQTGSSFPDCPALGPDGLESLADDDGIVCISATKGETAAAERLRELLARAFGSEWSANRQEELLAQVDHAGSSLEDWLRNGFFEQHCKLFHHRPFVWHIWDGLKNGFSALVNYHKLTHTNLEKLTYAYLGDWIRRQQTAVEAGEAGSDARLQAARTLQDRLKLILEGEPPYDIFVRWKPLSQQAIGWHPDINDGVRMNIRPFMATDLPGGKKGAGLLRVKPNIKWEKDRGKEPQRDKQQFPWFWQGSTFTGDRLNDIHLTRAQKENARK